MTLAQVGAGSSDDAGGSATTSRTLTRVAGNAGDFEVISVYYYENGNNAALDTPSGFTSQGSTVYDSSGSNESRLHTFTRECDGSESAGSFSVTRSASFFGTAQYARLRGASALSLVQYLAGTPASGVTTATAPTVTLVSTEGLVCAFGLSDPPNIAYSGPSGMTLAASEPTESSNTGRIYFESPAAGATGTRVLSWPSGTGRSSLGVSMRIGGANAAAGISIDAVGTLRYSESAVITVSNANASGKRVFIDGVEQTVTAEDATSITITVVRGGLKYGTGKTLYVIDGGAASPSGVDTESVSLLPQTGWDFVDLVDPLADAGERITAVEDIAGGDQLAWEVGQSSGSPTVAGVDVDSDASFNADTNIVSFQVEAWKGGEWGTTATQYLTLIGSSSLTFTVTAESDEEMTGSSSLTFGSVANLTAYANAQAQDTLSFTCGGAIKAYLNARGESTLSFTLTGNIEADEGELTGSSSLTFGSVANLTAYANARAQQLLSFVCSAAATAYANAAAAASLSFTVSSILGAYANARGSSSLTFGTTSAIIGYGNIGGAASLSFAPTANLGAYANSRGSSTLTFSVDGEVALDGDMQGASSITFDSAGNLKAYANLQAQTTLTFSATAAVTNIRDMIGTSSLTFAASGRASAMRNAQGTAALSFATDGRISAYANAVSSGSLSFSVDGRLVAYANIAGASSLVFSVSGRLASPFVPGVILFGVPVEVTEIKITLESTEFKLSSTLI